jgi:hypothetical protein
VKPCESLIVKDQTISRRPAASSHTVHRHTHDLIAGVAAGAGIPIAMSYRRATIAT